MWIMSCWIICAAYTQCRTICEFLKRWDLIHPQIEEAAHHTHLSPWVGCLVVFVSMRKSSRPYLPKAPAVMTTAQMNAWTVALLLFILVPFSLLWKVIFFNIFPELFFFAAQLTIDGLMFKPISYWESRCPCAVLASVSRSKHSPFYRSLYLIFHDVLLDCISYPSPAVRPTEIPKSLFKITVYSFLKSQREGEKKMQQWEIDLGENCKAPNAHKFIFLPQVLVLLKLPQNRIYCSFPVIECCLFSR